MLRPLPATVHFLFVRHSGKLVFCDSQEKRLRFAPCHVFRHIWNRLQVPVYGGLLYQSLWSFKLSVGHISSLSLTIFVTAIGPKTPSCSPNCPKKCDPRAAHT